ncbi:hypothetical protein LLEC1_02789 [Akanthomyces lecanii]|uniref:Uncharacterized protein n=1 Tax=Cordyceps confragosa TaxID=2714763 RepID=A0A179I3Y0_CORDF|nr:hypothetical protein LLEC1_02789 [Akanthomyces lecanii]
MDTRGANGNVGGGLANGGAFDASEPSRPPTRGKRQLSASTDQFQDCHLKKRVTLCHDGQFGPAEPHFIVPAAGRDAATSGAGEAIYPNLYDFPESEFDNADFELNLLNTHDSDQATESLSLQVPNEDIWQFFSAPPSPDNKEPPSSVLRDFDNISISTTTPAIFDPTLQFSPPSSASPTADEVISCGKAEEVSWEFVNSPVQHACGQHVRRHEGHYTESRNVNYSHGLPPATPPSTAVGLPAGMLLRPYKAWFHLREMLQAKQSMYKNQPDVVFEFFARVVHTRRENFAKKQLFQLRDLFKISPPYISGVLLN